MATAAVRDPIVHIDLAFGDAALTVREHPDGQFTLDVISEPTQPLVLNPDEMRELVTACRALGKTKGWR